MPPLRTREPRGIDFGAINQARAGRDRADAQQNARHDREYEFVTGLAAKGYKVKVLRADPKFNSITDAEWNTLSEGERLRNEQKKQDEQTGAALGTGASEGLAEQGLAATGPGGTFDEKAAFAERANATGNLGQLSGRMDRLERERGQAVAGRGLEQLSDRAVAVDTESRGLARELDKEKRTQATPRGQVESMKNQYILDIAAGREVDPNVRRAVDELNRLDPMKQLVNAAIRGGPAGGGGATVSPSEAESSRKKLRREFRASTDVKGWRVVKPNQNKEWQMDQHRAGWLIIEDSDGNRASWDGQ